MFCVLLYALVLYVKHASGEPNKANITLWQFGTDRLPHNGGITQPLRPVGVASNELSTTYIYEVLYPTTTIGGSLGTTLSTLRTIIASASGWVEVLESGNMECKFVEEEIGGECSDEVFTETGRPSPVVLAVQTSSTSSATAGGSPSMLSGPTSSDHQSSSTPSLTAGPSAASHSSQVGAIVGSTIAGLVSVCIVALILWLRRRRQRSSPLGFENLDASQERRNRSRHQELLVEPFDSHPEEIHPPMETTGSDIHPYVAPVLSIRSPNANSTQTENGTITNSMRSKRAQAKPFAQGIQTLPHQMTAAIDSLLMRRSEGLSSVSDPPPPYTTS